MNVPFPVQTASRAAWRATGIAAGERMLAEEVAVAFTYNRAAHAVMMATPADLEDYAIGFSLSEGIIARPNEIEELEIVPNENGIELRLWIGHQRGDAFHDRRRHLAGPTGCGLCGIESLAEAMRPVPRVGAGRRFTAADITQALSALASGQTLNRQTRAVHGAGYWEPGRGLVALREDVGRHNALDKLAGALARSGIAPAQGIVLLTSRVSVEMVQKAAVMGAPIVVAVSAPTALAVRMAETAGITLIAVARDDGFEVFTHGHRLAIEVGHVD